MEVGEGKRVKQEIRKLIESTPDDKPDEAIDALIKLHELLHRLPLNPKIKE